MVKVESILKWKLEGPVLKKIKLMRSQILKKNEDAVALPDGDLHVTLASGPGWKEIRRQAKAGDFDEPEFKIDIEPTFKVMEQGGRKSWYVRMKDQRSWKEYVMDLLQGTHDPRRVYHITIANLTGKTGDSIAMVEERDYKDEYKKFQGLVFNFLSLLPRVDIVSQWKFGCYSLSSAHFCKILDPFCSGELRIIYRSMGRVLFDSCLPFL